MSTDTIAAVRAVLDHLQQKLEDFWDSSLREIDNVLIKLNSGEGKISDVVAVFRKMCEKHRGLHAQISHFGHGLNRCFSQSEQKNLLVDIVDTEEKQQCLEKLICDDLLRNGHSEIVTLLVNNAEHVKDFCMKFVDAFSQYNSILQPLKENDIKPALEWCEKMKHVSTEAHDFLDYHIHEAYAVSLLSAGKYLEALNHIRTHLSSIALEVHKEEDLKALMACFMWREDIKESPYFYFFTPDYRESVSRQVASWVCKSIGMTEINPLEICMTVGHAVLPAIAQALRVVGVVMGSSVAEKEELPVEINAQYECDDYHSRFICPVMKLHTTVSNPPMRLACGHVISKEALHKLAMQNKVKCPYCPSEQALHDVNVILL